MPWLRAWVLESDKPGLGDYSLHAVYSLYIIASPHFLTEEKENGDNV